ncbi:MAG: TonB-dependent receptor [Thiotrichales bacterium]|nr:MAG: TonB-dependent receptor [Thiotrichales bacterium]
MYQSKSYTLLAVLALVLPEGVIAATEIPAVIVSAARTEQSTLTTPASITVITREQIEASGARHINDVLRGQGAVQINDLYGDGSRASVGMRGFGETAGSNTLVLVDGRRLNNPDIAAPDLNSIALEDIERIEIVQGSAGVLFGDQAVGGIINVITRRPAAARHALKLSVGSYSTVQLHASTSQALDNGINYLLSLDARESDNYRDHNEASYLNGFGKLGYDYASGSVFGELQYINDELNTPGTLFEDEVIENRRQVGPNFANDFSNAKTAVARLGMVQQMGENWSFEGELTGRDTNGEFRLSSVFAPETEISTQDRRVVEFTPRLIGFMPALNNTMLTTGVDLIASDYQLQSRFGDQLNDQSQRSVYAQAVVPASEVLDLTLGLRYAEVQNDLQDTGAFAIFPDGVRIEDDVTVGTLGLSIKADENWRILFRADQNYRFAKVDEYLQPVFTPTFTPVILKTQQGLSVETGVEWTAGMNTAKLLIYQLDIEDEIAFDPVNFANINLDETRRKGVIASGRWQRSERLGYSVSYTFTDAEVLRGAFAGKDIPLVARHSALLGSDYRLNDQWQLYAELFAISERVFSGDFDNVLRHLPGYGLVNFKAEYSYRDFVFSGRINNLLNKEYSDVGQLSFDPNTFAATEAFFTSPEINFLLTAAWQFR